MVMGHSFAFVPWVSLSAVMREVAPGSEGGHGGTRVRIDDTYFVAAVDLLHRVVLDRRAPMRLSYQFMY